MTDFFFLVMAIGSTFASEFLGGDADLDLLGPDSIEHFFTLTSYLGKWLEFWLEIANT